MTDLLPTIEELRAAPDDRARALWLLRCPFWIQFAHEGEIALVLADFEAGQEYLAVTAAWLSAVRDETGCLPQEINQAVNFAIDVMNKIARFGSARDRQARIAGPTAL